MQVSEFRRGQSLKKSRIQGVNQLEAQNVQLEGQIMVSGVGETQYTVTFPVSYHSKPILSFGGELPQGQEVKSGLFPTVNVIIANWVMYNKMTPGSQASYYRGCDLLITVGGDPNQKLIVFWTVSGIAFSGV